MVDNRKNNRIIVKNNIRVKEDNGELIKYYTLNNISLGGMFLDRKIKNANEDSAIYTIILDEDECVKVRGKILDTRKNNDIYGTSVCFLEDIDKSILEKF